MIAYGSTITCDPRLKSFHIGHCDVVWWPDAWCTASGPLARTWCWRPLLCA